MTVRGEGHVPGCCSGGKVFLFWSQLEAEVLLPFLLCTCPSHSGYVDPRWKCIV